jgi:replication-associated recombination protein RarA
MIADPKKSKLYESALIKSIRRGLVDDSIYWAKQLYDLNLQDVIWRRIFIHLSEDIGLADRNLPASIEALYNNYLRLSSPGETSYEMSNPNRLPLFHAVMLMATAQKSRAVDNAINVHFKQNIFKDIPDYAIDHHSPLGRRMGRGEKHFREEAGKIENKSEQVIDEWEARLQ